MDRFYRRFDADEMALPGMSMLRACADDLQEAGRLANGQPEILARVNDLKKLVVYSFISERRKAATDRAAGKKLALNQITWAYRVRNHHLGSNLPQFTKLENIDEIEVFRRAFDPATYIRRRSIPFIWGLPTNDNWFYFPAVVETFRQKTGAKRIAIIPHWVHGFPPELDRQLFDWFDIHLKGTRAPYLSPGDLSLTTKRIGEEKRLFAQWSWTGEPEAKRAELVVSYGRILPWHGWRGRYYHEIPARIEGNAARAEIPVPDPDLTVLVFGNVFDENDVRISTNPVEATPRGLGIEKPTARPVTDGCPRGRFEPGKKASTGSTTFDFGRSRRGMMSSPKTHVHPGGDCMKVLIVGGTGLISTAVTQQLLDRGAHVTLFNRGRTKPRYDGDVDLLVGDRTERRRFAEQVRETGPWDCVIDMICSDPRDAAALHGGCQGCTEQVIFCSTTNVYPKPADSYPVREDHRLGAAYRNGIDKAECERLHREAEAAGDYAVTVIRPGHTYGETGGVLHSLGQSTSYLDRLRRGRPIIVHGDGQGMWSALHADDVGSVFAAAAGQKEAFGRAYNACGEEWMTWNQYHQKVAFALEAPVPEPVHIPITVLDRLAPKRADHPRRSLQYPGIYDMTSARRDLGWSQQIPFTDGIRRVVGWLEDNDAIEPWDNDEEYEMILGRWRGCLEGLDGASA